MAPLDSWAILNPDTDRVWIGGNRGSRRSAPSLRARMMAKIQVRDVADCWEWTGGRNKRGYGTVNVDGRCELAPRVMFRLTNGYWPNCTRHTCDNPACCNPAHLLDGSKKDNAGDRDARGRNGYSNRTACRVGHEYTEENTVIKHRRSGKRAGQTYRACRTCIALRRAHTATSTIPPSDH